MENIFQISFSFSMTTGHEIVTSRKRTIRVGNQKFERSTKTYRFTSKVSILSIYIVIAQWLTICCFKLMGFSRKKCTPIMRIWNFFFTLNPLKINVFSSNFGAPPGISTTTILSLKMKITTYVHVVKNP